MSDPVEWADVIRWAGVVVAGVGAFVATPAAAERFARRTGVRLAALGHRARRLLSRWLPCLRRASTGTISGTVRLESAARGSVSMPTPTVVASSNVEERLSALEERVVGLSGEVGQVRAALSEAERGFGERLAALRTEVLMTAHTVRAALIASEERTTEADAQALPLVVLGVVLSGLAEDAARSTAWLVALVALSGVGLVWAAFAGRRAAHTWRVEKRRGTEEEAVS